MGFHLQAFKIELFLRREALPDLGIETLGHQEIAGGLHRVLDDALDGGFLAAPTLAGQLGHSRREFLTVPILAAARDCAVTP
jgi:hypothetical protein